MRNRHVAMVGLLVALALVLGMAVRSARVVVPIIAQSHDAQGHAPIREANLSEGIIRSSSASGPHPTAAPSAGSSAVAVGGQVDRSGADDNPSPMVPEGDVGGTGLARTALPPGWRPVTATDMIGQWVSRQGDVVWFGADGRFEFDFTLFGSWCHAEGAYAAGPDGVRMSEDGDHDPDEVRVFVDADGILYVRDDDGDVEVLRPAPAGSGSKALDGDRTRLCASVETKPREPS
jgi:hypothetical protein